MTYDKKTASSFPLSSDFNHQILKWLKGNESYFLVTNAKKNHKGAAANNMDGHNVP